MEYDVKIGIIGLEVAVTLKRPGYRIRKRVIGRTKIPLVHKITKEESIKFVQTKFGIKVGGKDDYKRL